MDYQRSVTRLNKKSLLEATEKFGFTKVKASVHLPNSFYANARTSLLD